MVYRLIVILSFDSAFFFVKSLLLGLIIQFIEFLLHRSTVLESLEGELIEAS